MQGQDYKNGLLLASTREAESDRWGMLVSQFRQLVSPSSERDAVLKKNKEESNRERYSDMM